MATTVDELQIEINAKAVKANDAIDRLVGKLDKLSDSIRKFETKNFNNLTSGLRNLNTSLKEIPTDRISNFALIANGLKKISSIDASGLMQTSKSIKDLSLSLKEMGKIQINSKGIEEVAQAMSLLGRKTSISGTENLAKSKKDIVEFLQGVSSVGSLNFDMSGLNNLVANLSRLGGKNVTQATSNLRPLKEQILDFVNGLNKIGSVNFDMTNLSSMISNISRLGGKTATQATANLKPLKEQILRFVSGLNGIGSLNFDISGLNNLVANISKLGGKSVTNAITNIPLLATSLNNLFKTLSKAPNINQNIIQMTQALANLASQGGKVGSASKSVQNGLNRTSTSANNAKKSFSGLAGAIGKFYANYFLVVRGLKGLWKSIEGTADYIEAFNYFDVALSKVGSDWSHQFEKYGYENAESYSKSFSKRLQESIKPLSGVTIEIDADGNGLLSTNNIKNLGLNIQEVTQYASQLASVTNSVGQTGEVSLATANAFTKLGADMSSLFNIDYSQVMNNLQSGLIGQSRALYRYGLDITQATLQTYAYELGLSKAVSEMTQAEKMQLRMIAILDQSKVAWGDLANTINSPSNMIRQLTNNLKEAGMMLGQLFIPMLQKVLPVINGVVIAIKRLLQNIANFFGIELKFSDFSQGFNQMEDSALDMSESLDNVASSAKKAKAGLRGFDELKTISMPDTSSAGGAVGGGGGSIDLTDEILKATEEYNKVWDEAYKKMENKAEKYADAIENAFKKKDFKSVGMTISMKLTQALSSINWDSVYKSAESFGSGLADFLNGLINPELFGKIGTTVAGLLNTSVFQSLGFAKTFDFKNFGTSLATAVNEFFEEFDFASLAETINLWVDGIKDTISEFIKKVDWDKVLEGLKDFFKNLEIDTILLTIGAISLKKIGKVVIASKIVSKIAKSIAKKVADKLGKAAIWKGLGSKIAGGLTKVLASPIAQGLIAGVSAFVAGWSIGTLLYEALSGEEVDMSFSEQMETIKSSFEDGTIKDAVALMWEDIKSAFEEGWNTVVEWWNDSALVSWWNENVSPFFTKDTWLELFTYVKADFEEGWNTVKSWWNDNALTKWWDENVMPFFDKGTWSELFGYVKEDFKSGWESINKWWNDNALTRWWDNDVAPWFTKKRWLELFSSIKSAIQDKWNEVKKWWNDLALVKWWKDDVKPWFTKEKWAELFSSIKDSLVDKWNDVKDWWSNNAVSKWFEDDVKPWFTKEKWVDALSGIKDAFESVWTAAMESIKAIWNKFANFLNDKLTFEIKAIEIGGKRVFDGVNIDLGKIPTFATGGFPEDGLFMANRGELVGEFSNGRTAVANNDQITKGIADAVYPAVYNAVVSAMSNSSNNQNVNVTLQGDVNKIFRAVQDESRSYTRRTGRPAFT